MNGLCGSVCEFSATALTEVLQIAELNYVSDPPHLFAKAFE